MHATPTRHYADRATMIEARALTSEAPDRLRLRGTQGVLKRFKTSRVMHAINLLLYFIIADLLAVVSSTNMFREHISRPQWESTCGIRNSVLRLQVAESRQSMRT
jgi:hypothetical protein